MIEPIMYFGIGFLMASLLGLVLIPLVHNRAVRLTMRRLEAATPISLAEIQADKDQLRAEFAMSTRRLELSVEQMKAKTTSQLAELGKKTDAINRLKVELGEKTAAIFALEAREKALRDQLNATENEHSIKIGSLREAERMLADKQAEMAKLGADLDERSVHADSQRIELVALRTQVEALRERVTEREKEAKEIEVRLERERHDASAATGELADERAKADKLGDRVGELERALVAQTTEAEILARRGQELETRLAEQMRALGEREFELNQARDKLVAADRLQTELRAEIASSEQRHRAATENLKNEKLATEQQLAKAREEHAKALDEIAAMKREAEQTWQAERVENALLRERINDIAAEIARLTMALEGQTSPIEALLTGAALEAPAMPSIGDDHSASGDGRSSLADRIRALQTKASRVQPN